jgi:hypothetical protein
VSASAAWGTDHDPLEAWRDGLVSPLAITTALDLRELYGHEVDHACGVEEPAVDQWEAAKLYPTWLQLQALSKLTGFPLHFFTTRHHEPPIGGFMCRRSGRGRGCQTIPPWTGPLEYPRVVVAACPGTRWHTTELSDHRTVDPIEETRNSQ